MSQAAAAAGRMRVGYARLQRRLVRALLEPDYPLVAVEVRPRVLAAVRLVHEGRQVALGAAATVEIPEGTLDVALTRPNVVDREAFCAALEAVLERVGALGAGAVSVVLPDPAIRLALVPADGLKGRRAEVEEMIRFRLHKALPFDVRAARIAWDGVRGGQSLVAVALNEVIAGYEEALETLGFRPGLVEVSTLAIARLAEVGLEPGEGDRLVVNWDETYVSFLLLRGSSPLLVRTLPGEIGAQSVARQAASTLRFYRERLGGESIRDVALRSAGVSPDEAVGALAPSLGGEPRLVRPWAALGGPESEVAEQAVAGAAACALRGVA